MSITEIPREMWIAYEWADITCLSDSEPVYLQSYPRDHKDMEEAGRQYDRLLAECLENRKLVAEDFDESEAE